MVNFIKKVLTFILENQDFYFQNGGVGEIRTLAPVSRSIPLAGAPLQPLEYVSKAHINNTINLRISQE